jgi:hypothetical protein
VPTPLALRALDMWNENMSGFGLTVMMNVKIRSQDDATQMF